MKHDLTFVGSIVMEASRRDLAVSKLENAVFSNPKNEHEIPFKVKAWDRHDLFLHNAVSNIPGFMNFGMFLLVIYSMIRLINYANTVSNEIRPLYLLGCLLTLIVISMSMNSVRVKIEDVFRWQ